MKSVQQREICICSVHVSIIQNSQNMDATQLSIKEWLDKNVAHIHNGILFGHEKRNPVIYKNMGKLGGHDTGWNEPGTEKQTLSNDAYGIQIWSQK